MAADGMSGSPPFERVEEKNGAYWSPEGWPTFPSDDAWIPFLMVNECALNSWLMPFNSDSDSPYTRRVLHLYLSCCLCCVKWYCLKIATVAGLTDRPCISSYSNSVDVAILWEPRSLPASVAVGTPTVKLFTDRGELLPMLIELHEFPFLLALLFFPVSVAIQLKLACDYASYSSFFILFFPSFGCLGVELPGFNQINHSMFSEKIKTEESRDAS